MATTTVPGSAARRPWLAAVLSAIVPGAGQLYARRYWRALAWFFPAVVALVALVPVSSMRTADLVGTALSPEVLWSVFAVNIAAAVWRLAAAADAFLLVRAEPTPNGEVALAVGWVLLAMAVLVPHVAVGRYTLDTVTLVEAVFVTDEAPDQVRPLIPIGTDADIVPDPIVHTYDVDPSDPTSTRNLIFREGFGDPDAVSAWGDISEARREAPPGGAPFVGFSERVGDGRFTILFAGGDAGPGRGGLRTDSMIVATIDTATGKAALFSFPRNMAQIPLPRRFANAFVDLQRRLTPPPPPPAESEEEGGEPVQQPVFVPCRCFPEQLNAIYPFTRKWTRTYPDEVDPGMAALRDVLQHLMGLEIDYYALIDMAAFVDLVDAIGGIDVYVKQPLESEVSPPREGDPWAYVKVEPGWNHLDGPEALAYARARKGSSDYARMERQRCMVKAVASKADPVTVLRSFPAIVDAIEGSVVTDIPLTFVPDLIEASAGLSLDDIETVGFTHSYWQKERDGRGHPIPNMSRMRWKVDRVLEGQTDPEADATVSTECDA
ncbi:MAG: LCP family protein [Acidimicrobiia bacterium]|nr:LCP family protein [Acidimicrobiia bacterium]